MNATVAITATPDQYESPIGPRRNDAADLIGRVRKFITDYAILPGDHYADILALYVLHTHAFDTARTTPYIYLTSQGPGSGKTRVMELMQELCRGSLMFSGMTGATAFRLIEARRPTLFLDEVDTIYSGSKNEDLRGVLNSGYKHNGSIPRVDDKAEDGFRDYSTWCPKVLAGIDNGQVPTTVMDRSIKIVMVKSQGTVAPYYQEDIEDDAADLQDELRAWANANADALRDRANRPARIDGISDRQNEIARPLLTIAARIPGWGDRARRAIVHAFAAQSDALTLEQETLLKVRDELRNTGAERIASSRIAEITGHNGKQVAVWFAAMEIPTGGIYKIDGKTQRGYRATDFSAAFDRFLPAEQSNK